MRPVLKKEIANYLNTPLGYIPLILFAVVVNFLFVRDTFITGSVAFSSFFTLSIWSLLIFVPAIAMRSFSEEKRLNTIEVLLSLPLSETEIILAKFFAIFILIIIALSLTLALPITFYTLSRIYLPEVAVGYLGALLTGASFAAIGIFFSSLTKNQIISFLGSLLTLFILVSLSTQLVTSLFPPFIQTVLTSLSPLYHLQNFMKGVVDFRSVFYFSSLIFVFLFLTIMQIEKKG